MESSESAAKPAVPQGRWGYLATGFVLLVLLALTLSAWYLVRGREDGRRVEAQLTLANQVRQALQRQLSRLDEPLIWNENLFVTNGHVSRREFSDFNREVWRIPGVLILEWTPWIKDREREALVARARREGVRDFALVEPGQGGLVPSPPADTYAVIYYAVAPPGIDTAFGLNVLYSPARRNIYELSGRFGTTFTTEVIPIFVSTKEPPRPGFVHSRPVYHDARVTTPEERWQSLRGWVAAVVTLDELFASSIDRLVSADFDLLVFADGVNGRRVIGERSLAGRSSALPQEEFREQAHDAIESVAVGDVSWGVVVRPTSAWLRATPREASNATLLTGLALSALITLFLWRQIGYRRREQEMLARLGDANASLRDTVLQLERTQGELVQAEKLAALGSMVAGVSHELNTPIGNALVAATTLRDAMRDFEANVRSSGLKRSHLDALLRMALEGSELVIRSVERAGALVQSFKQTAVDQMSEQRRAFDLQAAVRDTIASLRPRYKHEPWQIEDSVAPGIVLDSYPGPLEQIVVNLVMNAIVHGFEGRDYGRVTVSGDRDATRADWAVLTVADDGKGIAPEHLGRVFDPFFTTKFGQGGSGIGLNVAYRIATGLLGGSLEAHSTPGAGARFVLRLPLRAPATI